MMGGPRIKLEQVLFACAVALGLILRFMNLGAAPLSDAEASWALQALDVARGGGLNSQVAIGPQPGYIILTGLLFKLFGATNFLARFWPAFAGTLLICSPVLLRKRFSREVALIAAAGMAFDPGLVTVARQAGGPMMALGFTIAALVLWLDRRYIVSGILAGLALLSGPSVFYGLLALTIALLVPKMFHSPKKKLQADYETPSSAMQKTSLSNLIGSGNAQALIAMAATIFLVGSGFFQYPQGLAAWVGSLAAYVNGWSAVSEISPLVLVAALLVFQPFALAFAVIAAGRWLIARDSSSEKGICTFSECPFLVAGGVCPFACLPGPPGL